MAVTLTVGDAEAYAAGGQSVPGRGRPRSTIPAVTVGSAAGITLPAGSRAATVRGDEFRTTAAVTIPAGGQAEVDFESVEAGPIYCHADELTTIVAPAAGWTVLNRSPCKLGDFDYVPSMYAAAVAAVERYAPGAPDAIHNRAFLMTYGFWIASNDNTAQTRELDGDRDVWHDSKRSGNALRFSGAMALLSPFKRRRALG